MSLSTMNNSLLKSRLLCMALNRHLGQATLGARPKAAVPGWRPPSTENGYFDYERDYSRDSRYTNPPKLGDTWKSALMRKLGHAYEVYPIFILVGMWFSIFVYSTVVSFEKIEVWLDRSGKSPAWDWEKVRDNYWKKHTLIIDPQGVTHRRLPIMEKLQDEMLEAAKKRGTR